MSTTTRNASRRQAHEGFLTGRCRIALPLRFMLAAAFAAISIGDVSAAQLQAGVAKVDITNTAGPVNDPLYAKALVLKDGTATAVIITVDAVAIGEIGPIKNAYLPNVRAQLLKELNIQAVYQKGTRIV